MTAAARDLWDVTWGRPVVDADVLAQAVERQVDEPDLDFRTRLLIRDSLNALRDFWGERRFDTWFGQLDVKRALTEIWNSDLGPEGFSTLRKRIMQTLKPEMIRMFLRELGGRLAKPTGSRLGDPSR
jgi:hypothetical protein